MALVQVVPSTDGWSVLADGNDAGSFDTQQQAIEEGRTRARALGAEFQLHGKDGTIRQRDSYGNDPRDVQG